MNRKKLTATIGLAALLLLAGCGGETADGTSLAEDTGSNVTGVELGESYAYEVKQTEKNQINLVKARPPIEMQDSLERQNLIRRYEYLNDQNNQHYVYMISHDGKVIDYSVAQGKVSSVNSKLTNDKQIVARSECLRRTHREGEAACYKAVESPQMDGSYGSNGNAIFWFTPDGDYMEWNGLYLVSEQPKSVQTAVTLTDTVGDEQETTSNSTSESITSTVSEAGA